MVGGAYGDAAVIGHIYGGAGFFDDCADYPTTRTDHQPDLLYRYLDSNHLGSVGAHLLARLRDGLAHLIKDEQPSYSGLLQRFAKHLGGKAGEFDVHLEGVYALGGSGDFEIHVAQEIFDTLNIAKDGVLTIGIGNQAHGYSGHRRLHRDAGVHQRHRGAADTGHGGAAVGTQALGNHPDGVGKLLFIRQRGQNGPLRQRSVTDFPPAR